MHNAWMAEWVLSLVTSRERATSTVGDLLEDGNVGGTVRLWASVLHTTGSLLLRDLAADPGRMIRLGVLGVVFEALLAMLIGGAFGLVYGALLAVVMAAHGQAPVMSDFSRSLAGWSYVVGFVVPFMFADFWVGRWLARKSPGRELAPCVAMTIISFAVGLLLNLITSNLLPIERWLPEFVAYSGLAAMTVMAGAITIRRQRLRAI